MAALTLSIIIPALDAERFLPTTLAALGSVDEIIVSDGGSRDGTRDVAAAHGARAILAARGRGPQLAAGAAAARGDWLLFLHADTILEADWRECADRFIGSPSNLRRAAAFRFALDDPSRAARRLERLVGWRAGTLGLPFGDQGLLIHRDFLRDLGGYRPWPLMEDVDLVRQIGRGRLSILPARAVTSAGRWRCDGWWRRSLRNLVCLGLYYCGVGPDRIRKLYG